MECGIDIDMYNKIWYKTKVVKKILRFFKNKFVHKGRRAIKLKDSKPQLIYFSILSFWTKRMYHTLV